MFSSNITMCPPPKRRRIDVPASQVDEDIFAENEANGGSDIDSELEFEDDSDLGAVEDIEPEITPGQTMVLGLQSGKSWAEVESKLYPVSYSGTSIKTIKKRQEEEKKHKKHVRQFNKMTKYFPKSSSSAPAPTPALEGLDREIEVGQGKVRIETIRRWYHRMMRWLDAYETGAGAVVAQEQVQAFSSKKYKSHRRAPEDDGT